MHTEGRILQSKATSPKYSRVFEPGYIGKLWVKNRIIKAPTLTSFAGMDGCVTDRLVQHYEKLSQGGAGLVIVEYTYVDDDASRSAHCQPGLSRDGHRPGMEWLSTTIKANGAAACLQLVHAGRQKFIGAPPIKTATRYPWEELYAGGAPIPEELTCEEIGVIVGKFGDAAFRAKQVGFDMIEIHAGHGYMLTNFLSPKNRRMDWYGGTLTNRMRILLEIVADIRGKVGFEYPISIRLSAIDYEEEDPINMEETIQVAKALERAGVDLIHVSGGDHHTMHYEVSPMYMPPALHVNEAEAIKKAVSVQVAASGSITTPDLAEQILDEGKADFISLGRPLLADPFWPLKAQEGHSEDIRPCIRCDQCISERGHESNGVVCSVNPSLGKEGYFYISQTDRSKKVGVIGGGPAGMEAARVAAMRGHNVTLFEKRDLGGRLIEASAPDFKADLRRLVEYLSTQIHKKGIKLVRREATYKDIKDAGFDIIVIAIGGIQRSLDVPGLNKLLVNSYLDILMGAETGEDIVVIGGGLGGCDVALYLAEQGKNVTIVDIVEDIGGYMNSAEKKAVFERLSRQSVEMRPGRLLVEVLEEGAVIQDKFGNKETVNCDGVVIAAGFESNLEMFEKISNDGEIEVYAIGDCVQPRQVFDAIHEGFWVGSKI